MGQSVGWLVVWMVVLLLLKCRTRRPREAEVSCLFRDGSGRNSSMRCGENTPRERGCKKQQLSTLSIKVFTCIYSELQFKTKDTILREAEVSCLFRDGSGRNSSMRGKYTAGERL